MEGCTGSFVSGWIALFGEALGTEGATLPCDGVICAIAQAARMSPKEKLDANRTITLPVIFDNFLSNICQRRLFDAAVGCGLRPESSFVCGEKR
jgi:hypothetical protein